MGAAAWTKEFERPTGKVLVRLINPQPWELVELWTWNAPGVARGRGAVDQECLHQRRAVGAAPSLEELLHESQDAGGFGGGQAGAGLIAVERPERLIQIAEDLE